MIFAVLVSATLAVATLRSLAASASAALATVAVADDVQFIPLGSVLSLPGAKLERPSTRIGYSLALVVGDGLASDARGVGGGQSEDRGAARGREEGYHRAAPGRAESPSETDGRQSRGATTDAPRVAGPFWEFRTPTPVALNRSSVCVSGENFLVSCVQSGRNRSIIRFRTIIGRYA